MEYDIFETIGKKCADRDCQGCSFSFTGMSKNSPNYGKCQWMLKKPYEWCIIDIKEKLKAM